MGEKNKLKNFITLVSGLPRSGTSMMMQMLKAGGMEVVTDEVRKADEDNPRGYFELEQAKKLKENRAWLAECRGKAVKVISILLFDLPGDYTYKIILMKREMGEVLASQKIMLERRGENGEEVGDEEMVKKLTKHLQQVEDWIGKRNNIDVLYCNYGEIIKEPLYHSKKIKKFLGEKLNDARMAEVVEEKLYRQRKNLGGNYE